MKRIFMTCVAVALLSQEFGLAQAGEVSLPEYPLKKEDTRAIRSPEGGTGKFEFSKPYIPPYKTTGDGRVGIELRRGGGMFLFKPEKLQGYFFNQEKGSRALLDDGEIPLDFNAIFEEYFADPENLTPLSQKYVLEFTTVQNVTLCEPTNFLDNSGETLQPTLGFDENGEVTDDYRFQIIFVLAFNATRIGTGEISSVNTFASIDAKVVVKKPKTPAAYIDSVAFFPDSIRINTTLIDDYAISAFRELNIAGDGRLCVGRVGTENLHWPDDEGEVHVTRYSNLVYLVYNALENGVKTPIGDVTRWKIFYPVSHAPFDRTHDMKKRYKFANFPFRDPTGALIPDGADFFASYPWIDRQARNLFVTTIARPFYSQYKGVLKSNYPEVEEDGYFIPKTFEEAEPFQDHGRIMGVAVLGLWTYGKMILLDGMLNNTDYSLLYKQPGLDRKLRIYEPVEAGDPSFTWMGTGRDENDWSEEYEPLHAVDNATQFESLENRFNFNFFFKPATPRDVVWQVSNGRTTDEVVFDDYVNPHMLISSDMVGALEYRTAEDGTLPPVEVGEVEHPKGYLFYCDGFRFRNLGIVDNTAKVLVQNAATTLEKRMKVPLYGVPVPENNNTVRIEPLAMGGLHGKGLWLDGKSGVRYAIPEEQPEALSSKPWYIGLFADRRSSDDGRIRILMEFVGSAEPVKRIKVGLKDGRFLVFLKPLSGQSNTFEIAASVDFSGIGQQWSRRSWNHLGLLINPATRQLTVLHNGFPVASFENLSDLIPIEAGGQIILGYDQAFGEDIVYDNVNEGEGVFTPLTGVKGWYDNFTVMAHLPTLEEMANHARGTLIRVNGNPEWEAVASTYPAFAHDLVREQVHGESGDRYACYLDNNTLEEDALAPLYELPAGTVSLRQKFLFPEETGELLFNHPRPDSRNTQFCLSCHIDKDTVKELKLAALKPTRKDGELLLMQFDKRQPMQAPNKIYGAYNAYMLNPALSQEWIELNKIGHLVDKYLHPDPDA